MQTPEAPLSMIHIGYVLLSDDTNRIHYLGLPEAKMIKNEVTGKESRTLVRAHPTTVQAWWYKIREVYRTTGMIANPIDGERWKEARLVVGGEYNHDVSTNRILGTMVMHPMTISTYPCAPHAVDPVLPWETPAPVVIDVEPEDSTEPVGDNVNAGLPPDPDEDSDAEVPPATQTPATDEAV